MEPEGAGALAPYEEGDGGEGGQHERGEEKVEEHGGDGEDELHDGEGRPGRAVAPGDGRARGVLAWDRG